MKLEHGIERVTFLGLAAYDFVGATIVNAFKLCLALMLACLTLPASAQTTADYRPLGTPTQAVDACRKRLTGWEQRMRTASTPTERVKAAVGLAEHQLCAGDFVNADRNYELAFSLAPQVEAGSVSLELPWIARIGIASATRQREKASTLADKYRSNFGPRVRQGFRRNDPLQDGDDLELVYALGLMETMSGESSLVVAQLSDRILTIKEADRDALAERLAQHLWGYAAANANAFTCAAYMKLGIAMAAGSAYKESVLALERAIQVGREYMLGGLPPERRLAAEEDERKGFEFLHMHFRCGGEQFGGIGRSAWIEEVSREQITAYYADALMLAGEPEKAMAVAEPWNQFPWVKILRANAYELLGRKTEAVQILRQLAKDAGPADLMHEIGVEDVTDPLLRMGSYADVAQISADVASYIPTLKKRSNFSEEIYAPFEVARKKLVVMADLAHRLAAGDVQQALGCAAGGAEVSVRPSGERIATTFDNHTYYEYCRAWAFRQTGVEKSNAEGLLLAYARENGLGANEVATQAQRALEAAWKR